MNEDSDSRTAQSFTPAEDFMQCRREAKSFAILWLVQSTFMICSFVFLGYGRTEDPFDFAWGMPAWFLVGVLGGAVVFLCISIVMAVRMKEDNL